MTPADKIRARVADLEAVRANYIGYLTFRQSESDWHGCWDASVNISETECEIAGLRFALDAIEGVVDEAQPASGIFAALPAKCLKCGGVVNHAWEWQQHAIDGQCPKDRVL